MKLAVLTTTAVILSAGYALAGAGAPVPEGSQKSAAIRSTHCGSR